MPQDLATNRSQTQAGQNRRNHARLDPAFHFTLAPGAIGLFLWTLWRVVRHLSATTLIEALLALLLLATLTLMRVYSLRVQDRVIRLEERLRLGALLPEALRGRISELTVGQLIALRFASDREVPSLVARVLDERLTGAQIKDAIQEWRGDYLRV